MSPYFFHLKFELYPVPAESFNKRRKTTHDSSSSVFIPVPGSDIFKTSLPKHRVSKWASETFAKVSDVGEIHNGLSTSSSTDTALSPCNHLPSEHVEPYGNALLLPERSANLRRDVPPSPRAQPVKPSNKLAARDWRYDAITIESIDMEAAKINAPPRGGLHTKAVYIPPDTKATDVGYGVVHLYRDAEEAVSQDSKTSSKGGFELSTLSISDKRTGATYEDCTTLSILAVPSWMMPSDLLGFVGDQAREDVSHFRLIRTGRANKYMVLMKFRTAKKARDWQKANNGRVFSAAEPENCHVVFIRSVEFLSPNSDVEFESFPRNTHDPFISSTRSNDSVQTLSSKPLAPPPPNLLELPTCPVCLERMDETTGLLTILCQHVFHCACLEKWRGSGCPVCRYTHSPSFTFPFPRPQDNAEYESAHTEPLCSVCGSTANLWICLICGNIGCGRYDSAHAYAHYEATSHCYAMDVSSQHVWDYAGDGYVHRLIQNKATPDIQGKAHSDLPSRPRHENEAFRAEGGDSVPREKMENMANEYAYLLTSQLEGQRRYFEEQVERAVDKASQASARAEESAASAANARNELQAQRVAREQISETLARVEKALERSEKARGKFEQLARDMSSQLREEKSMNEGLLERVRAADRKAETAREETEAARTEKKELEDMNHDLTMFISSQEKVKELQAQGEDVVDGSVVVPEQAARKGKGKVKKK